MDELKARWNSMGLLGKVLTVVLSPLLLILLLLRASGGIQNLINNKARAATDTKSAMLDQQKAQTDQDIARTEGQLSEVQAEKEKAVQDVQTQDTAQFINNRYKSDK